MELGSRGERVEERIKIPLKCSNSDKVAAVVKGIGGKLPRERHWSAL